ncbi:peripheral inner membrane phage-shock protein [Serratia fonticola]|uniref:Phage shock protein PspD n=1 Tax=Serratia fonticola TaxID=47917 RepID=A0AAE7JTG9_SERFO|nr:phage shock protein PspD [Serratia fonticola]QKJ59033.1 phage shock protein PspD [Serratia fonticola]WMT12452.1 phage shock protein PspD [Serratia fonticola]CAI1566867.1 peripheral inner membrane phage-shock protein [Serratia fonticola]
MSKTYAINAPKTASPKWGVGALLKTLSKIIIIALMSYGPAGATAWLLKTVSRKPLRYVLALLLEPLFRKGLNKAFGRYAKENNETTAK